MQEFFSFNFLLREYYFCTSPAPPPPPPPNKFSNGPSLNLHGNSSRKEFYCIDQQHGRLVT